MAAHLDNLGGFVFKRFCFAVFTANQFAQLAGPARSSGPANADAGKSQPDAKAFTNNHAAGANAAGGFASGIDCGFRFFSH